MADDGRGYFSLLHIYFFSDINVTLYQIFYYAMKLLYDDILCWKKGSIETGIIITFLMRKFGTLWFFCLYLFGTFLTYPKMKLLNKKTFTAKNKKSWLDFDFLIFYLKTFKNVSDFKSLIFSYCFFLCSQAYPS